MPRPLLNVGFSLISVLFAHATAFAQTASTGAIRGNVVDATGAAMSGVAVGAVSATTGIERKGVTETGGLYTLGPLPPRAWDPPLSPPRVPAAPPPFVILSSNP